MELFNVFILLAFLAAVYFFVAKKYNIVDKPNSRSSHDKATIRGGGILFYIAILIFYFTSNFQYSYFVLGVSTIAIVSFIDDLVTLNPKIRLPFQVISLGFVLFDIGVVISPFWIFSLLILLGIFVINIYNFMDGINGITGLYSISVISGLILINFNEHIINNELLIYSLLSLLVFGFYNFRKKALFFAGDIGSITMGMLIFFSTLFLVRELESPVIILLLAVYGCDSLLTLLYRKYIGENLTQPHRHHIYQKLIDIGEKPHLLVSLTYMIIQVLINIVVYLTYKYSYIHQLYILIVVSMLFILLYVIVFIQLEKRKKLQGNFEQ